MISLCMIVGTEAGVIERCLGAAAGAFDKLCLVRAVGSAKSKGNPKPEEITADDADGADGTVRLAERWCAENGKGFVWREYVNARALAHVDDFAKARNLSFGLASGEWQLWLDADDLLDEINCRRIREVVRVDAETRSEYGGYRFLYRMPTGAEFMRERLIRRGQGRWKNAVHELCEVKGALCDVPQVVVLHAPPAGKERGSAERNLTILEEEVRDLPRQWYYYHEELFRLGRPEALAAGVAALKILPAAMVMERYEVMLNLVELDPEREEFWAFEAIKAEPMRREAVAYLVQQAVRKKDAKRARAFLGWLDSIPVPVPTPWTHRAIWHGWARNYLEVQVLRLCGDPGVERVHAGYLEDASYREGAGTRER